MFTVYAISSVNRNYIYVGLTNNIDRRFFDHNNGYNKTTKPYRPFEIIYTKSFNSRVEARKHEKYLKSGVGKEFLKKYVTIYHDHAVYFELSSSGMKNCI